MNVYDINGTTLRVLSGRTLQSFRTLHFRRKPAAIVAQVLAEEGHVVGQQPGSHSCRAGRQSILPK